MSHSRRPTVSIYDYPEHLNPFSDENTNSQPQIYRDGKTKESKHKFWTFGRSRKKRSNSFSLKSTWNGLFGKRKDAAEVHEKRSTITTVSTAYKREPFEKPVASPRVSKDQQEFDEALGTLARRRKYTLESSSRYSSSMTVNGDPARIYEGSPKDTTASIMGDLTPKPPARRFGQVSPKPTDKLPALDYDGKEPRENGGVPLREKPQERTPVPPLRRFGNRSSQQRLNASAFDSEDEANRSADVTLRDENENVPEDYVFKRFSQDAVRRSNLSINSCVSVGSTMSGYGRKKRRAPPPPRRKDQLETPEENVGQRGTAGGDIELQINEPIDIAAVTENIHEMTKKSIELDEVSPKSHSEETATEVPSDESTETDVKSGREQIEEGAREKSVDSPSESSAQAEARESSSEEKSVNVEDSIKVNSEEATAIEVNGASNAEDLPKKDEGTVEIEYRRTSQDKLEIIKDVDQVNSASELEDVCLRKKGSSGTLSRSDSFSVKEEIEKIERQIKALETRNASKESEDDTTEDSPAATTRQSIQANRRHFFQDMVEGEDGKSAIKIEFKELPREQKDIHVVRLTDPPVPVVAPRDPVKVIELHITEPIRQKSEILEDVNPIPKPRRHSSLNGSQTVLASNEELSSDSDARGKSF